MAPQRHPHRYRACRYSTRSRRGGRTSTRGRGEGGGGDLHASGTGIESRISLRRVEGVREEGALARSPRPAVPRGGRILECEGGDVGRWTASRSRPCCYAYMQSVSEWMRMRDDGKATGDELYTDLLPHRHSAAAPSPH
jgi:hypothetical protein